MSRAVRGNLFAALALAVIALLFFSVYKVWALYAGPTYERAPEVPMVEPDPLPAKDTNELLPDMVPLPASDMQIRIDEEGRTLLLFSTTYFNQGEGPMELRADPNTAGIRSDIERKVLQRIFLKDGGYDEELVGTFLWHQEHLHYHFADFIEYDLEQVDAPSHQDLSGSRIKATFCLRDVSRVDMELEYRVQEAGYTICGKERQGVSVGWGDTYYYTYPAQYLDISDLASGTYKFTQRVNPGLRLKESDYKNNVASVVFKIDKAAKTVQVLEESPSEYPEIEYVHLDKPLGY